MKAIELQARSIQFALVMIVLGAWLVVTSTGAISPLFLPPGKATIAVSVGKPLNGAALAALEREEILQTLSKELHLGWDRAQRLRRK